MGIALTVIDPFDGYSRGDRIDDPDLVAAILASERVTQVVQVAVPDAEPQPTAKKGKSST